MPINRSSHDLHINRFAGKKALYVTATNRQSVGDDQNKVKRNKRNVVQVQESGPSSAYVAVASPYFTLLQSEEQPIWDQGVCYVTTTTTAIVNTYYHIDQIDVFDL